MNLRLPFLLCAGAAIGLGAPAAAQATDLCVPAAAACPGGLGVAQATLTAALDTAGNTAALDRIYLAAGTFTAPTAAGFDSTAIAAPVEIHGAGSSGAGRTVLTAPATAARTLRLFGAAGSKVAGLEVAIPANAGSGPQLHVGNVDVADVAVTGSPTQSANHIAVGLEPGSSLHDSSVNVSTGFATGVQLSGAGTSVARATILAKVGIGVSADSGSVAVDRVNVFAEQTGVAVAGSTLALTSSLVRVNTECALTALDQPSADGILNADGVTLTGTAGTTRGACASSLFDAPRSATVNVINSVLRDFTHDRSLFSSSTGTAAVNIAYSNFDPSTDVVPPGSTGPTALGPAQGVLGATNVTLDPLFVGGLDFRLATPSPVRDLGDPAASGGLDLDGMPRLCGRRDMGAYEFQGGATCAAAATGGGGGGGAPVEPARGPEPSPVPQPLPAPPASPAPPVAQGDRTAPVVGAPALRRHATTLRFALSEHADVTVLVQRRRPRSGGRPSFATQATIARTLRPGVAKVRFNGRGGEAALPAGRYRAVVEAVDAAGNRATRRSVAFRVPVRLR
jgi:hypothetical protein